jgi:N-acetylglucosamine kinase-like BadF-type ATPase
VGIELAASAWGISGWDRPKDEAALLPVLRAADLLPDVARVAVNDAFLLLRAGSPDGTGIAVVSGTGSNCVARGADGVPRRIGGLAFEFGDGGSGSDIGREGIRAAFRGADGRGPGTLLTELLIDRLDLERIDDLVDHFIADAAIVMNESHAAPLVFDAATLTDPVATQILKDAGRELAVSARTLARQLYKRQDTFPLVLGGSVLQRATNPVMREALIASVHDAFPNAVPETPTTPPLLGAALLGLDRLATLGHAEPPTPAVAFRVASALHEVS